MLHLGQEVTGIAALIATRRARVGIIGLGYVGLPLAVEFAKRFPTLGFDVDAPRVAGINAGQSHIGDVPSTLLETLVRENKLQATTEFERLANCDCVIVCVPTPLDARKEPDLSYIVAAGKVIAQHLRPGQLIVLESTTYPGTTDELLLPILQKSGLELDRDFHLAFSPERVDPGNTVFELASIPKVVGGCSAESGVLAAALYGAVFGRVHPVSNARVAETTKLLENTFRAVNIGLVNEMALMCDQIGISSREVIEAAATKPFGFMAFHPGPGVGGHCIPLDPLYLSWKAREYGFSSRFIALADEVNSAMPEHVVALVARGLNDVGRALRDARILVLGVAYKEDVADLRNSPALTIIDRLRAAGAIVRYHDPFVPFFDPLHAEIPAGRVVAWNDIVDRRAKRYRSADASVRPVETQVDGRRRNDPLTSSELSDELLRETDCVLVATAHRAIDYERVGRLAKFVVDTRSVIPDGAQARVISL
ncbi:MAG TPA: nucleotide sugar dehydrogenase [Candidatus Limnocylindria bacterium]|jgi:UDP-N-acetyl-D-glucosamine dehydrogenase|nr:nucleotide sugar dehydrogenase [Candidatus Limnocylindria bacterium]